MCLEADLWLQMVANNNKVPLFDLKQTIVGIMLHETKVKGKHGPSPCFHQFMWFDKTAYFMVFWSCVFMNTDLKKEIHFYHTQIFWLLWCRSFFMDWEKHTTWSKPPTSGNLKANLVTCELHVHTCMWYWQMTQRPSWKLNLNSQPYDRCPLYWQ